MKNKSAEGLRGIAVFNVAIAHFICAFLPMMLHNNYPTIFAQNKIPSKTFEVISSPIFSVFYNGHFAVIIFFVLSGYVLTIPYFKDNSEYILQKRLWGRYLRLNIPIAAAIIFSLIVYKFNFYSNIQASELSGSTNWLNHYFLAGISYTTAFKESLYESIFLGKNTLYNPLWPIKMLFIGSIYVLLFYISKPHQKTVIPLILVFLSLYIIHQADSIYYMAIFAGSCLNSIKMKKSWNVIFFALGLFFGAFQFESKVYEFLPQIKIIEVEIWEIKTFYNTIGAIFLTAAVVNGFGIRFFENKFIQFLGEISFSLYLIHFIVLCSLSCTIYLRFPQNKIFLFANLISYVLVCFLLSKIFDKYIDKQAIKISHKFSAYIFK